MQPTMYFSAMLSAAKPLIRLCLPLAEIVGHKFKVTYKNKVGEFCMVGLYYKIKVYRRRRSKVQHSINGAE